MIKGPLCLVLREVSILTAPHTSKNKSTPKLEIYEEVKGTKVWTSGQENKGKLTTYEDRWEDRQVHILGKPRGILLVGGTFCKMSISQTLSTKKLFRCAFNTAFVPENRVLVFRKADLDPDVFVTDPRVSPEFELRFKFTQICDCTPDLQLQHRCLQCKVILEQNDENCKWLTVETILNEYNRQTFDPVELMFGCHIFDDVDTVVAQEELANVEENMEFERSLSLPVH
jgi:hypothetical protein